MAQADWRRIGVDARIQVLEQNAMVPLLRERRFDAALFGWSTPTDPDLGPIFGAGQPFNFGSFEDSGAGREMELARRATTEAGANLHWKRAANRIVALQPYTFLFYTDVVRAASPRLRGVRVTETHVYGNSWEWWVAERSGRRSR